MERNERLLPIPSANDLQLANQEYPSSYPAAYEDDLVSGEQRSIREYFNVVYKRLPIILALTIIVTAAVAFYMYRQPSIFMAKTQLIVEKPKPTATGQVILDLGNDPTYYNTQLKLLDSPDLMRQVVINLGLYKEPNLFKNDNKGFTYVFKSMFSGNKSDSDNQKILQGIKPLQDDERVGDVKLSAEEELIATQYAGIIGGGIIVDREELTNLVNISVTNQNAVLAAVVADGIANTFMRQEVQREIGFDDKNLKELTKNIADLKITIDGQTQQLIGSMQNAGQFPSEGGEGVPSLTTTRLGDLSGKLFTALDDLRKVEAEYNTVSKSGNLAVLSKDNLSPITNNEEQNLQLRAKLQAILQDYDKQINDAELELKKLRVKYKDEYKPIQEMIAKIDFLKDARKKTEETGIKTIEKTIKGAEKGAYDKVLRGLRAQVEAARIRESQLRGEYNKEVSKATQEGILGTKLTTLKREIETNRSLLDNYIQEQKRLELKVESSRPDNITIASSAGNTGILIGPQRNRNIILAFLVSLVGGIGLAFLLDYLDDSIRSSDDISRYVGLPTLALIPHHSIEKKRPKALQTSGANPSSALSVLEDNRSPTAEAYRHLRTSLLFSSAGKAPKKILITSSQPSEGKTTTAINTAITLSQSGAKVVIIDCDLRRPRLHNHFNMENGFGLTNYLSGEKDTSKIIKDFEEVNNLKVITSGPIPPNPAELLSSQQMKNLLTSLSGIFDHIIIDSPPAISFTDAAILSTHVDGVVLVAMAGKSSMHLMKRFKQRLTSMGAKVYGVVLNGIKPNSLDYSYYGYGYTYSYYENTDDSTPMMDENKVDDLLEDDDEYVEVYEEFEDDEDSIHETDK